MKEVFTALDSDVASSADSKSALYLKWSTKANIIDPDGEHIRQSVDRGGVTSSEGQGYYGIGFNASRCNPIYRDDVNTVQPPAIMVFFWRRIANNSNYTTITYTSGSGYVK